MKTIDEKAWAYAEEAFQKALETPWNEVQPLFAKAFKAGVNAVSQWLSPAEALPDLGRDVLTLSRNDFGYINAAVAWRGAEEGRWFSNDGEFTAHRVLAWCEIPQWDGKEGGNG